MADTFDPYHVWLGIPPEERPANHYRLLGLRDFESNPDVITNALDQRRAHLRSVQAGKRGALSQQLLNEVSAAGVCLLDEEKKKKYDAGLQAKLNPVQPAAKPTAASVPASAPVAVVTVPFAVPVAGQPGAAAAPAARQPVVVAAPFAAAAASGKPTALPKPVTVATPGVRLPLAVLASLVGGALILFMVFAALGLWMIVRMRPRPRIDVAPSSSSPQMPVATSAGKRPPLPPPAPPNNTSAPPSAALPVAASPLPAEIANRPRFAFVFTGKESVLVPLPLDLTQAGAPFTIEMWAKWDEIEPAARLFGAGPFGVYCRPGSPGVFNRIYLLSGSVNSTRASTIRGGEWFHLAATQDHEASQIFINGKPEVRNQIGPRMALVSPLVLGDLSPGTGPTLSPFSGLIRDLRVTRGCRYTGPFTPESRFGIDPQTAVLVDFSYPRQWTKTAENLAGPEPPAILKGARRLDLTPAGEVAAELADGTVDLLKAFNINDHGLEQSGVVPSLGQVETGSVTGRSRHLIPYRPPAEYDLEIEFTRLEGSGGPFVGLEIAGRPIILAIDYPPPSGDPLTGLLPGFLSLINTSSQLVARPPLLATGQERRATVQVRLKNLEYSLLLDMGGQVVANSSGYVQALACPAEFAIPLNHGMSFGSIDAKIRFSRLILRPVSKTYSPVMLAVMASLKRPSVSPPLAKKIPPSQPPPSPPPPTPGQPAPAPPPLVVAGKLPVPSGEKLATAIEQARKLYEPRFKQATKTKQKRALASDVRKSAEATHGDPVARYVMLDLARKFFMLDGYIPLAINVAQQLEREYDLPPYDLMRTTVEGLDDATSTLESKLELGRITMQQADDALFTSHFAQADRLAVLAAKFASRVRDANARKELGQRRTVIGHVAKEWTAVQPSLEKLKTDPTNAAAKLAIGKFCCFTLENYNEGIGFLAESNDATLAPPARLEQAARLGNPPYFAIAQAWQEAASKTAERDDKHAMQCREKLLLQDALRIASGLDRLKIEKRLEELKDATPAIGRPLRLPAAARPASPVTAPPAVASPAQPPTLVIYNSHNRQYQDRGTTECDVILLKRGAVVQKLTNVRPPWQPLENPPLRIPLTTTDFDLVRIELNRWRGMGAGLAEVALLIDGQNVLLGKPVRASEKYEPQTPSRWLPSMINDGISDEDKDGREGEGYWLLPNNSAGWIEINR